MDKNKDGSVSYKEFKKYFKHLDKQKEKILAGRTVDDEINDSHSQSIVKTTPKQVFNNCDKDGDGALKATEVREALEILGFQMDDDAFNTMFQECEKDKNDSIDFNEFKNKV